MEVRRPESTILVAHRISAVNPGSVVVDQYSPRAELKSKEIDIGPAFGSPESHPTGFVVRVLRQESRRTEQPYYLLGLAPTDEEVPSVLMRDERPRIRCDTLRQKIKVGGPPQIGFGPIGERLPMWPFPPRPT